MILKNTAIQRWAISFLLLFPASSTIAMGGVSLAVLSSYNYDSNVFRSTTNAQSSRYYLVEPRVGVSLNIYKLSVSAGYVGSISHHPDFPQDNTADLSGFGSIKLNTRGRYFDMDVNYDKTQLERESIETSVLENDSKETADKAGVSVRAGFPMSNSRYELQLQLGINGSNYSGLDAEKKNNIAGNVATELRYRYSGKTSIVYGYKADQKDITSEIHSNFDSVSQSMHVGARWLTTGKTSSHALIGYEILQLSDPGTSTYGGLSIDVSIIWQRKSYSQATLTVTRSSSDSLYYGTGFLVNNKLGLAFSHSLTSNWLVGAETDFFAYQSYAEYRHYGGGMQIKTSYNMRWVSVGLSSGYHFRYSLANNAGYPVLSASANLSIRY